MIWAEYELYVSVAGSLSLPELRVINRVCCLWRWWTLDLQLSLIDSKQKHAYITTLGKCSHLCASITKQYYSILTEAINPAILSARPSFSQCSLICVTR